MNDVNIPASDSYQDYLIESLRKDPQLAADYIMATLEEENPEKNLLENALLQVTEALDKQKNFTPQQIQLQAEKLRKLMAKQGDSVMNEITTIIESYCDFETKMVNQTKAISCFDVADFFIWLANETGSFVSNLKLQKLVYYAQSWHLTLHEKPLFENDFEAWIHGPVIPELYKKYQRFKWYPINEAVTPKLPLDVVTFLQEVADEYFACDAYELEKMTHIEKPWKTARGTLPVDEPSHTIIRKDWIKEYFTSRVQEQEENQEISSI